MSDTSCKECGNERRLICTGCWQPFADPDGKEITRLESALAAEREKVVSLDARRGGECDTCGGWVCPPLRCVGCMMKNRVCDSANPLPLAADVVKKLDAENLTLKAERDALADRVRGLEVAMKGLVELLDAHGWGEGPALRAARAALTPPAPAKAAREGETP